VIFSCMWGCQIYLNDDVASVRNDCEAWCVLHGTDLPEKERNQILACKRRLDVFCDSDPGLILYDEFDDLKTYLRLIFDLSYVYDARHKRFILD
jgi:hypothetical protein